MKKEANLAGLTFMTNAKVDKKNRRLTCDICGKTFDSNDHESLVSWMDAVSAHYEIHKQEAAMVDSNPSCIAAGEVSEELSDWIGSVLDDNAFSSWWCYKRLNVSEVLSRTQSMDSIIGYLKGHILHGMWLYKMSCPHSIEILMEMLACMSILTNYYEDPDDDGVDHVNHPSHYESETGIECKDWIRDILGFYSYTQWLIGSVLKYMFRFEDKGYPVRDLTKAMKFTEFLIELEKMEVAQ